MPLALRHYRLLPLRYHARIAIADIATDRYATPLLPATNATPLLPLTPILIVIYAIVAACHYRYGCRHFLAYCHNITLCLFFFFLRHWPQLDLRR